MADYDNPRFLAFCKAHGVTVAQFFAPEQYRNMLPFMRWIDAQKVRYFQSRKIPLPRSSLDHQIYNQSDWTAFLWEVANNEPTQRLER
jgi:hypothetical protein